MNAERLLAHYEKIADAPDAIARLRRFILDLAVRGKLVPQDPNDEPASELLKRFAAEKAQLMKAGKIRKPKALAPINSDDIPVYEEIVGWIWVRLGEASSLITKGSTPTSYGHAYTDAGVNFVKVESIRNGVLRPENITSFISEETNQFLARSRLTCGDILFSIAGSIGTCAVVTEECLPANTNQALAIIRGTQPVFTREFLLKSLQSSVATSILGKARGGAMNNVSLEDIQNFVVPLPPIAEQRRIVAKVDELMALCDQLEKSRTAREETRDRLTAASLARLNDPAPETFQTDARFALDALPSMTARPDQIKQLRQTILNLAVRGKLVPQDPKEGVVKEVALAMASKGRSQGTDTIKKRFDVPRGWKWRATATIADQITDGEHATPPRITDTQVPLVTAKNVREGFMDYAQTDWVSRSTAEKAWGRCRPSVGDILLVCVGATTGRLTVLREPKEMVLVRSVALIRPNQEIDAEYLERAIRSPVVQNQIWASVKVAAQPCLYINRIQSLLIPVPPLPEQKRIVTRVDELMSLCDRLEVSLAAGETARSRLLDALLHEALEPAVDRLEAAA